MLYYLLRPIAILLCKILFRIQVKGKKNIPKKGGFILASNHLSYLDPVVLGVACPRKLNFMARDDLFTIPLFSTLIRCLGAFPVKRNSPDISAFKETFKKLKEQKPVVIFPEGRRNPQARPIPAQPGVGFIASYLGVPVIPAYIKGTDKALPMSARFIRLKKVSVCFGEQIFIERRKPHNYAEIAQQIMDSIRRLECRYP
ncbi:MAG: 1-acyl-sn-glycerol-3-phosphate acyltransferase [Candidatus Omnitrophica bacterium]|nr:1-acyl-sn-glycerol-3-phosphate acyltransferase [Candidatus Omnitrophota bacterium]